MYVYTILQHVGMLSLSSYKNTKNCCNNINIAAKSYGDRDNAKRSDSFDSAVVRSLF